MSGCQPQWSIARVFRWRGAWRTLEELEHVVALGVEQREHLGMRDPLASSHPLHVAVAKPPAVAEAVRVIDEALARHSDRLKTAVGVLWKAGDALFAVVHCSSV